MRVGLLEDDVAIQEMLLLVLQDEDYMVVNFASAEECLSALEAASQEPEQVLVDLMIIDLRLAGSISGVEVIRRLRHNLRFDTLPIILTTAATMLDLEELQDLHVALLEKPFAVDDMISLIHELTQL